MCDSPVWRPKRDTVVESTRILIFKLNRPGRAAVLCFVDAKICWIPRRSNRHQISNAGAESLYIAELQCFCTGHYPCSPCLSAVRSNGERAGATGSPDHLWVHGPHGDQTVGGAAILRSERGLMKTRWREFLRAKDSAGKHRDNESNERLFRHGDSSKELLAPSIGALRRGSNSLLRQQLTAWWFHIVRTSLCHSRRMR